MTDFWGQIAALSTATCWAFTSTLFTISSSRIGSVNVNRIRLVMAAILVLFAHYITMGKIMPYDAGYSRWMWLGASGIVGFVIGDAMLFEALVIVGTRITMLLQALVPVISAILAWILWGEILKTVEIFAILLTIVGILWVVADKNRDVTWARGKRLVLGLGLAIGGALGQATGLILSKKGLEGGFPALSGNFIRLTVAVVVIWIITLFRGRALSTIKSLKDKKAVWALWGASFFGPFVGVWLSLVAIKSTRLGVAATLMSITPILLIPIAHFYFKEKIRPSAIIGTFLAITGVAILLLTE